MCTIRRFSSALFFVKHPYRLQVLTTPQPIVFVSGLCMIIYDQLTDPLPML